MDSDNRASSVTVVGYSDAAQQKLIIKFFSYIRFIESDGKVSSFIYLFLQGKFSKVYPVYQMEIFYNFSVFL